MSEPVIFKSEIRLTGSLVIVQSFMPFLEHISGGWRDGALEERMG